MALGLFEDAKENEININSISLATTVGEEKFGGSTYIKEYFGAKDQSSAAAINASSTIMAPSETKGSILSVFKQKVKLFASRENLSEMLSYSDIDLESIGKKPTAVFIVIQDEKKTYHSLVTILLKQIYETLISVAQSYGGKLPVRTNFLLDEFPNMPPLKDVTTMITAARSRRIRFTMIIQNFAQLDSVYGKEDAETIRGNCGNTIYLITSELKALEEISKMCGEVKSKKDDKTASTPLVTVSDLQRMKQFEVIILRMRKQPFKTKFTPYFKLDWGEKYPIAKYPTRPKREVHTFDIKEFVKAQKKKKLLEMMNGADDAKKDLFPKMNPADFMKKENVPFNRNENQKLPDFLTRSNMEREESRIMGGPSRTSSFSSQSSPASRPTDNDLGFDVDELVKKIDAKIAELEEEERRNKAKETANNSNNKQPAISQSIADKKVEQPTIKPIVETLDNSRKTSSIDDFLNTPSKKTEITNSKPLEEKLIEPAKNDITPKENLVLTDDDNDDDDFFDDFFDN